MSGIYDCEPKQETVHHDQAWYSWPHTIHIPKGWSFISYCDREYRYAYCDMEIDLDSPGDWVEMVNDKDGTVIRHVID